MATTIWKRAINGTVIFLVGKLGLNLKGAEILEVPGRSSGRIRSVVVNPFETGGVCCLMSAHGESDWVKSLRAAGGGTLMRGKCIYTFRAHEMADDEKLPFMRAYLQEWGWQVKGFMGVDGSSTDDEVRAILPNHPMFRI